MNLGLAVLITRSCEDYSDRVSTVGVGLALVLITTPAAADIGEPVRVSAPVRADHSYKFFEGRDNGRNPGAYWNPCKAITYGIDFRQAQRRGLRATWEKQRWQSVIAEVSKASGLRFRYKGSVMTKPQRGRPAKVPGVDIVLSYGTAAGYGKALAGSIAGVGGVTWQGSGLRGRKQIISGYVVVDVAEVTRTVSNWQAAFDPRPVTERQPDMLRALYMHEFGHAIGLAHVKDRRQLMYPTLSASRPDALGAGDIAGLSRLGTQRCF